MFYVRISGLRPFLLNCVGKALSARALPADAVLWGRDEQGSNSNVTVTPGCHAAALWCAEWDPLPPHTTTCQRVGHRWIWHWKFALPCNISQLLQKSKWQMYLWWKDNEFNILYNAEGEEKNTCRIPILFAVLRRLGSGFIVSDTYMFIELLIFLYVWLSLQTSTSIIYSWISKLTKNNSELCISQRYKCLNSLISYLKKK